MQRNNRSKSNKKFDKSSEEKVVREQPKRDRKGGKRVNFDNTRISDLYRDIKQAIETPGVHSNEIRFYNSNPQLLEAAARIQFYNITGYLIDSSNSVLNNDIAPGILSLVWTPQLGGYKGRGEINRAAQDLYSYVVHANSRNTSYNANDLMLMCLGVAEIYSALALAIKVYGCMRLYDQENAYKPDAILLASGFTPSDLKANYSHMWFDINRLITQANTLWIPNDMPFVERRVWMNQHVFTDANGAKAQMYTFKPQNLFQYSETSSSEGGELVPYFSLTGNTTHKGFGPVTWQQYIDAIQVMITSLNESEDRGVMMGDILKAYGPEKLFKFNAIPMDYETQVVYDPLVLSQIENAVITPAHTAKISSKVSANVITAIPATYTWTSGRTYSSLFAPKANVLNVHHPENPSIEEITEITRLTQCGSHVYDTTGGYSIEPYTCGTETICCAFIYVNNYDAASGNYGNIATYQIFSILPGAAFINAAAATGNQQTMLNSLKDLGLIGTFAGYDDIVRLLAMFDWAPISYMLNVISSADGATVNVNPLGFYNCNVALADLDNYTIILPSVIERLNAACLYSEFGLGQR